MENLMALIINKGVNIQTIMNYAYRLTMLVSRSCHVDGVVYHPSIQLCNSHHRQMAAASQCIMLLRYHCVTDIHGDKVMLLDTDRCIFL